MPKVSVVMSVYNGEQYLRDAVDSILQQTLRDFEFIIIDDGSTDGTAAILDTYTDPRVIRLRNCTNIGLTKSLNRGLSVARGEYVARMDSDNVSLAERLEQQVAFLDAHPEVGLIGAGYLEPGESGQHRSITPPTSDWEIRWHMLFDNCIDHPSCLFRRTILKEIGPYDERISYSQDYDLFSRISNVACIGNLPERLTVRRTAPGTISVVHAEEQAHYAMAISRRNISRLLGRPLSLAEVDRMRRLWTIAEWLHSDDISKATIAVERLLDAYCVSYRSSVSSSREISTSLSCLRRMVLARVRANAIYYQLAWVDTDVSSRPRLDTSGPVPGDPHFARYLEMVRNAIDANLQQALARYLDELSVNWAQLKWRALTKSLNASTTAWRAERDQEVSIWLARAASLYGWAPWQIANALPDYASDRQGHPDDAAIARFLNIVDAVFTQAMEQVPHEHKETLDAARRDATHKAVIWYLDTSRSAWDDGQDDAMQDALLGAIRIAPADVPWQLVNALPNYGSNRQGHPDAAAIARYLNIVDAVFTQAMEQVPHEHKETLDAARADLHYKTTVWLLETARAAWDARQEDAMQDALLGAMRIAPAEVPWQVVDLLRDHASDSEGHPDDASMARYLKIVDAVFAKAMEQVPHEHKDTLDAARRDVTYKAMIWYLDTARAAWDAGGDDTMQDALLGAIRIAPADVPWQLVNALPDYASDRQGHPDDASIARYLNIVDAVFAEAMEQVPHEHKDTLDAACRDVTYKAMIWYLDTARAAWDAAEDGIMQDALLGAIRVGPSDVPWQLVDALPDYASDRQGLPDQASVARYIDVLEAVFAQGTEQVPEGRKEILRAAIEALHYKALVWCLETVCDEPQSGVHQAAVSSLLRAIRIDQEAAAWWIAEFLWRAGADAAGQPCPAALKQVLGTVERIFAVAANRASADEAEAVSATWQKVKTRTAVQEGR